MNEPIWVEVKTAINIHDGQVALFGGSSGIRDIGLLESALDRPKNRFFYEPCTLLELAAADVPDDVSRASVSPGNLPATWRRNLKVAEMEERHMRAGTKTLISLLAPILILIVGALVGFMVIALLLPIFKMSRAIH